MSQTRKQRAASLKNLRKARAKLRKKGTRRKKSSRKKKSRKAHRSSSGLTKARKKSLRKAARALLTHLR